MDKIILHTGAIDEFDEHIIKNVLSNIDLDGKILAYGTASDWQGIRKWQHLDVKLEDVLLGIAPNSITRTFHDDETDELSTIESIFNDGELSLSYLLVDKDSEPEDFINLSDEELKKLGKPIGKIVADAIRKEVILVETH